jgi:hypothetical protein
MRESGEEQRVRPERQRVKQGERCRERGSERSGDRERDRRERREPANRRPRWPDSGRTRKAQPSVAKSGAISGETELGFPWVVVGGDFR